MKRSSEERENELLQAIVTGQQAKGYAPTRRELAGILGISTTRVQQLVESCTAKGHLARVPRAARAYVVTEHATRTQKAAR